MAVIRNLVLASLPRQAAAELLSRMAPVELVFGEVLHEPGQPIRNVYFPLEGMVSLLTVAGARLALEVAMVGREGMVGVALALGVPCSPMRAQVHGGGSALKMSSARFEAALAHSPALRQALLAYANALMGQLARTAACNRFHLVEARLARWLLMTRDRAGSDSFAMTQEFLSGMLGVRRVGVSAAASTFRRRKLIDYSRGRIRILDHAGLEAACCSCYRDEPASLPAWRPAPTS
jgi:CRP-like cAMP-binding protein